MLCPLLLIGQKFYILMKMLKKNLELPIIIAKRYREKQGRDVMKVSGSGFKPTTDALKAYNRNQVANGRSQINQRQGDSVQLSQEATFKKEIETALKNLPEVREDLVNNLSKEIKSGNYQPDAHKIADGILQDRLLDKKI